MRIFIGYDSREPVAYHTLAHSLLTRSSQPLSHAPVALHQLPLAYRRDRGPMESTEFSISRFLVPYLSGYEGYSLFMDCDMLCLADIHHLWKDVGMKRMTVHVCQHDYTPKTETKMDGQTQTVYPRKNWSSFMLFDNAKCRVLTPEYVSAAPALDLHRFHWLPEAEIGSLPLEWNWLVGEYPINYTAKMLHYTLGGPWFPAHRSCDRAEDWLEGYRAMTGQDFYPQQVWELPK